MKILEELFFILIFILFFHISFATETITSGTSTFGTSTQIVIEEPYISEIKIIPNKTEIIAGESVSFFVDIIWSDGIKRETPYNIQYNNGVMTEKGWIGTQAGISVITVFAENKEAKVEIKVKPAQLEKIKFMMTEPVILYGKKYSTDIFKFEGMDKFQNMIILNKIEYKVRKKTISHLAQWTGNANPLSVLNEIIKTGAICNSKEILFFDTGEYELLVIVDGTLQSTFSFEVKFDRFSDVISWQDYRVVDIDVDKGSFIVEYIFPSFSAIQSHLTVLPEWLKIFKEGTIIDRIQILCWCHYKILEERERLLKDLEFQALKNLLLKPLKEQLK